MPIFSHVLRTETILTIKKYKQKRNFASNNDGLTVAKYTLPPEPTENGCGTRNGHLKGTGHEATEDSDP